VENLHSRAAGDTTTTTNISGNEMTSDYHFVCFTPSPALEHAVPILLFQSGHGSSAKSHEFLLKRIANEGFVVIVPEHPNDLGSGDLNSAPNRDAAEAVFRGSTIAELQTDGCVTLFTMCFSFLYL
jgi:predicted dienelactone hydrolase